MPEAAEVESARTLANQARRRLKDEGFDDVMIDRLAERYVGSHGADDLEDFIDWALAHREVAQTDDLDRTGEQSFPASDPPSTWTGAEPGKG